MRSTFAILAIALFLPSAAFAADASHTPPAIDSDAVIKLHRGEVTVGDDAITRICLDAENVPSACEWPKFVYRKRISDAEYLRIRFPNAPNPRVGGRAIVDDYYHLDVQRQ